MRSEAQHIETDPLVPLVEQVTLALFRRLEGNTFVIDDQGDVVTYTSDSDFLMFNGVAAASFAPGQVATRARTVLDTMIARGKPFLWWTTDSTRSPELVAFLEERGLLLTGDDPGMYLDLSTRDDLDTPEEAEGITLIRGDDRDVEATTDVFIQAFDLPPETRPYAVGLVTGFPRRPGQEMAHVLALVDGEPAGSGVVLMIDGVAGLYNIGVLPSARRRGIGAAVTRELLRIARDRGCSAATLYASQLGYSVYAAEGFETHGSGVNYAWLGPAAADSG
jgi:ribosomal protein S18 acetylase RimI-like enzyme